ncbi:DUF938 domain-containing protein [Pseudooceanicola sp. MF1-13]|uniref:DUF938 domain-containing protein n=1 Tax=Pseudooceanicola sp. MF1-13 TaxID=3379095 RepID=UPI003892B889
MTERTLPPTASVTEKTSDGRLIMPAALRNITAISDLVAQVIDGEAITNALEIASGTGQHILHHAKRHPEITWQPTDVDEERITSINAYAAEAPEGNILTAQYLDATKPGWSDSLPPQGLIVLVNLLHLISTPEAQTLIREVGKTLKVGGTFVLYGPFMRGGELTSDGDRQFHADLTAADPEIGYKDDFDVTDMIHASGMSLISLVEMPANNLAFVARRDF